VPFTAARRRSPAALVALVMAFTLLPASPAPAAAAGGTGFVTMVNGYRHDADLGPVAYHSVINTIAAERGRQIERNGEIGHDFDYLRRRFDEEGICWRGFGEIVASNGSGDFSAFGNQWFNSPVHHDIMLGDYTHASGSREDGGDRWFGVMVFVKLCNATNSAPTSSGFTDLGHSTFIDDIEWLVEHEITNGCAPTLFCPHDSVSRAAMATFLVRGFDLPPTSVDFYTDDETSGHEPDINSSKAANVTSGCGAGRYCPTSRLLRGQMAAFLDRALDLPPTTMDFFSDDDDSGHEGAINRLAAAGITSGCAADRYCPRSPVSREQMAAFLRRALD
jgi:uncharacterized protein YkwD